MHQRKELVDVYLAVAVGVDRAHELLGVLLDHHLARRRLPPGRENMPVRSWVELAKRARCRRRLQR